LQPEVVSGPLRQSTGVASQAGAIAIDARFSEYGDYSARMVAAVSRWWNEQVQRTGLGPRARDTTVRLRFKLDRYGDVSELEVIGSSSTRLGTVLCKDAVMGRAPYGEWTQDMVNTLGEEMTLTFTFHYR
jgi:hypothetical protein